MLTPLIIVALLTSAWLIARLCGVEPERRRSAGVIGAVLVFLFTGVGHFIETEPMTAMLPDVLPWRMAAVYASGVLEIVLAGLLMIPRWRRLVGWCLIAMLVLFLPINVYATIERVPMGGHAWGPIYLLIRVPLQALLIWWVYCFVVRERNGGD